MHVFKNGVTWTRRRRAGPVEGSEITTANIDFRLLLFYSLRLTPFSANHLKRKVTFIISRFTESQIDYEDRCKIDCIANIIKDF